MVFEEKTLVKLKKNRGPDDGKFQASTVCDRLSILCKHNILKMVNNVIVIIE